MSDNVIRVLIIGDDREDAHMAAIALRKAGPPLYEVRQVDCLLTAFAALDTQRFDIVLLDLGLSGSQGLETLEHFRGHDDSIPIVVLSGLEDEAVAIEFLERDAQDFLFKDDVNARSLSRTIRSAIQRQNSVREIRRLLGKVRENEEVLKTKNQRLERLYETAHAFVDNVSHEFRTPLTVIKEYVSLVRDGTMGEINAEQHDFLTIVEDRADDLNTMVDDMLDVSKLEAGLLGICRRTQEVCQIVNRVVPSLTRKSSVRDVELEIDVAQDLPPVYCDGEKIERVIINLVVNAMKFNRPGGRVTVSAHEDGADIVIGVTDTGPGIPEECLRAIFERFEQVDTDVRRSEKGFGLGLNIAKELVELNLGRICVESEVGVGSTFSFSVPKADPIDVSIRYLKTLQRANIDFVSLVVARVETATGVEDANDVDTFLRYLVRGNDLAFRVDEHHWTILLPAPELEAELFLERATRELAFVNRNRPRGALPNVDFQIDRSWTDLKISSEEVVSRVRAHFKASEGGCVSRPDSQAPTGAPQMHEAAAVHHSQV